MKHFIYFFLMAATILPLFTSCKNKGYSPREVTEKFLNAIQHSNYQEAKKYATKDSNDMLDALAAFQKMLPEASRQRFKNGQISILDVKEQDTLAIVTYNSDKDTAHKTLKLRKTAGRWKVAFTKEAILPDLNQALTPDDSGRQREKKNPIPSQP